MCISMLQNWFLNWDEWVLRVLVKEEYIQHQILLFCWVEGLANLFEGNRHFLGRTVWWDFCATGFSIRLCKVAWLELQSDSISERNDIFYRKGMNANLIEEMEWSSHNGNQWHFEWIKPFDGTGKLQFAKILPLNNIYDYIIEDMKRLRY